MTWTATETNTHQDHVIAHVIGATSLGHFIWDETAYLLLDIGFVWNIYLDMEMGLVPQALAVRELEELRSFVDELETRTHEPNPIESVELFENGDDRRVVLHCELSDLIIETSISHRWTRIESMSIRG
jgi:hypothetical protein